MSTRPVAGFVAALAFLCELAMLALLVVAGLGLTGSAAGRIALAVVLPIAAAAVWGYWMAPRSPHRLADPQRLGAQVSLFVVTGWLVASAGYLLFGVLFAVVAIAVFAWGRRVGAPAVASTRT